MVLVIPKYVGITTISLKEILSVDISKKQEKFVEAKMAGLICGQILVYATHGLLKEQRNLSQRFTIVSVRS